jgi:hypothetical protein
LFDQTVFCVEIRQAVVPEHPIEVGRHPRREPQDEDVVRLAGTDARREAGTYRTALQPSMRGPIPKPAASRTPNWRACTARHIPSAASGTTPFTRQVSHDLAIC